MSDKKRTTVKTIETHEVWIIRRAISEGSEIEVPAPDRIGPQQTPPLRQLHDVMETNESGKEKEP